MTVGMVVTGVLIGVVFVVIAYFNGKRKPKRWWQPPDEG